MARTAGQERRETIMDLDGRAHLQCARHTAIHCASARAKANKYTKESNATSH